MIHRNATMAIRLGVIAALLINIGIDAPASEAADISKPSLRIPKHGGVYVVAHRGAHNGIPENSLAAYKKAIELGVDFVEIDIRTTKDGRFVSIHNASIDAYVEGASGNVRDFTLDELRALDIGSRVGKQWKGTRIPTIEEVLALCKGKCGIYLDLKEPAIIFDVAKTVHESGMEHDVLWYGPVHFLGVLKELQQRYPECIVMPDPIREKGIPAVVKGLQPKVMAATWDNYSKSFVDKCHVAGAIVIVDESDPSCWEEAIARGSDGIQTDHPAKLIRFLEARKLKGGCDVCLDRAAPTDTPTELNPVGAMHIPIGVPNSLDSLKTFVEAEGGFSPGVGSFGVSVWVYDSTENKLWSPTMKGVSHTHGLADGRALIPWSEWTAGAVRVHTEVCEVRRETNEAVSYLVGTRAKLSNPTDQTKQVALYVALRPRARPGMLSRISPLVTKATLCWPTAILP